MKNSNYEEGAYYYTHLVFMWGPNAIYNDPSIYCIQENDHIWFPALRTFLSKEECPCMYIPFYEKKVKVRL